MGLVLTIVYIILTIISPEQFGLAWANYHVLIYLAVATALFSLPNVFSQSSLRSSVQTYLLLAFIVAVGVSQIANHWLGGALQAWLTFLPSAAVYFFIVANVTTVRRLKIVALASVAACMGLVGEAFYGYYGGFLGNTFFVGENLDSAQTVHQIIRLRAVGFLNDPNDFAQMLIIALALLFVAWSPGKAIFNSIFVVAPTAVLLWAIYLTHSRGALIGLAVLALIAGYRRLGKVPSLVLTGMLVLGLMALDFTGGRAIDASAGVDRLSLWATGLELLKSAPIFGVGFGNFLNFSDHTAHNSLVLAWAETGIVGGTIWLALLVTTTLDLNRLIALREKPALALARGDDVPALQVEEYPSTIATDSFLEADRSSSEGRVVGDSRTEPPEHHLMEVAQVNDRLSIGGAPYESRGISAEGWPPSAEWPAVVEMTPIEEVESKPQIDFVSAPAVPQNLFVIVRLALVSFMVTGWFLSRTFDTTVYLVLGLATAAVALDPSSAGPRDHRRWIMWTLAIEAFLVVFVYLVVRLRH